MARKILKNRRSCITTKVTIGTARTLYLSVDDVTDPNEVFLRIKGEAGSEKVSCFDVIARLISMALQEGIPMAIIASLLHGTRSIPAGIVTGDDRIKFCDGSLDFIGKHLLIHYGGREDLAHMKKGQPLPYKLDEEAS